MLTRGTLAEKLDLAKAPCFSKLDSHGDGGACVAVFGRFGKIGPRLGVDVLPRKLHFEMFVVTFAELVQIELELHVVDLAGDTVAVGGQRGDVVEAAPVVRASLERGAYRVKILRRGFQIPWNTNHYGPDRSLQTL